ncbi:4-hydroxythreonine-4-phosphate dehydrogenase [Teratosphaeria destructans]|uniref:4-hydroxythreonine-4-phosphate dehydrogenase n=1 Tax=Teratosphaeria destructans TaxID=418781 RepID=A0A9W7SY59_9PEZI|nr:4-hydroxythreonine-4-phosphate dehydrogenase [Teratosphaeria destructans]
MALDHWYRPRIAVTLGDMAGVGPELVVKLLNDPRNTQKAEVTVLADHSEIQAARNAAGGLEFDESVTILDDGSCPATTTPTAQISRQTGERCIYQLRRALDLWRRGQIDGIVFAPLNKSSLKLAGLKQEDELRWFADQLDYQGTTSEINIAGPLWTARVTSHIALEEVAEKITKSSTLKAIELLHKLRWESGIETPRLAVCALNPHNGENGSFGRQEIDAIVPAIAEAQSKGICVQGSLPCDTIFLKRKDFDGIVTMYHDQGQIAMKLLSFEGGVTVQGGLPVVITTPAHGTAFDIVGKNMASVASMQSAFDVAVTMATRRMEAQSAKDGGWVDASASVSNEARVRL